ncbi:MAG: putative glycoside hydrolase [Chloroflexota bacterium]
MKIRTRSLLLLAVYLLTACTPLTQPRLDGAQPAEPGQPPTSIPTGAVQPPALLTPAPQAAVQLAWFYKEPDGEAYATVAQHFQRYILTHGNEDVRRRFIEAGARGPFLEYLRFEAIHNPGECDDEPWNNQAAYNRGDFCRISLEHPDWFLLDEFGARIVDRYQEAEFVRMDPGNPGWQAFFLERARQVQETYAWDGVFLDNVEVSYAKLERKGIRLQKYPDEQAYLSAIQGFLKHLYEGYFQPQGKLLYANLVATQDEAGWAAYLPWLDGVMHEGWAVDWPNRWRSQEQWEAQLSLAEQVQQAGKFMFVISQGRQEDAALQEFAFASYLLINQGQAAFRYAHSSSYRGVWLYDNYRLPLGLPLGPRYRQGDAWRRDYTNGYVTVDPQSHAVQIVVTNNGS